LLVEDICLVSQWCSPVTVRFDDGAVADYFDRQVDGGLAPERFARIWIHTHPGDSARPSGTDEETFERCFGSSDWAVMFILARGGQTYARLRFSAGPGGAVTLPVEIDFQWPFAGSDWAGWEAEFARSVAAEVFVAPTRPHNLLAPSSPDSKSVPNRHRLESRWDDDLLGTGPFEDFFREPFWEFDDEHTGATL